MTLIPPPRPADSAGSVPDAQRLMATLRAIASEAPMMDAALYGILVGNAVTLAGALFEHWPALPVLWVYWGQSVMIGVVNVIRIMCLEEFSTEGFTSGGKPVPETSRGKANTAGFFAVHYGFFHLIYALFLTRGMLGGRMSGWMPATVLLNVAIFGAVHGFPLWRTHGHDLRSKRPNLGALMFYPYIRILPMHLTIILGSAFPQGALPLFILLKTGSDVALHLVEQKMFQTAE